MKKFDKHYVDWSEDLDKKTIAEVRNVIDGYAKEYGEDAVLEYKHDWDTIDFFINVPKRETEEERLAREAKELAKKQKKEAADRAKFEKLKSEYGW